MKPRSFRAIAATALTVVLALPAVAQVRSYKKIRYPALPEFKIEKPTVYTLQNGVTVFLMEDHELPLIQVNARVRSGSDWEPAEKTGLASLMGDVQRTGGTARMTGDEIDDYLAVRAATIETGLGKDSGYASMSCLQGDFDDVFKVFAEILRTPAFSQDKLDLAKVQRNTAIARRNDQAMGILMREFQRVAYGADSPLGRTEEYGTIAAVTRDDLVAWHKKYCVPGNLFVGVAGDFDPNEMKDKIEAAFGDWPKGEKFVPPAVPYREPEPGVYFVEKSDVNQAYVSMGHIGIETKNPDYFAIQVMNEILGGGFASRMFSNVRSKKGLAYNVFGAVGSDYLVPGLLRAGLQTKSQSAVQGIEAVKAEIVGIIENPPDDAELKKAKDSILNSFVFNYDSKAKILNQQMQYAYYGLPADFLEKYRTQIEKVTRDDVARVAKKYVHPDRLAIVVVGKAADFDKPLSTVGKVTTLDITIPPPPDKGPKAAKTAAGLEAGRKIFAKMVGALGGKDPGGIQSFQEKGKMAISMGGQSMSLAREVLFVFPDRVRQVTTTPMGEQVAVLSGGEGFVTLGGQVRALPAEAVKSRMKELPRDLHYLIRYASDPQIEAVAAGEEDVDGMQCQIVAVTYQDLESRLWVAPDGKVLKEAYQGENPLTRAPGQVEMMFSDYRDVNGMMVPHKRVMRIDGQEAITLTIDSFTVNPKIDEALFQKPGA